MPYLNNFNGYANPYMSNYPNQNQMNPGYTQPQQDTMFKWVQGRAGAEAFSLAPGTSAFLMDSNEPILYAKATDSYGRYMPLQSYKLVPMDEPQSGSSIPQIAESIDYERIRQMISEEIAKVNLQNGHQNKREGK